MKKYNSDDFALKRCCGFVILWPLLCASFAGFIAVQSGRTADERISGVGFTIFPLVFFGIGMAIHYRLLKERRNATALTTAVVVSEGRRKRTGKNRSYFPEFEFQADGRTCRVKTPRGSGFRLVKTGDRLDLYYAPENPQLFYVPVLQKYDRRCSWLFCGIGIVFPLLGLFAPQINDFFTFLP